MFAEVAANFHRQVNESALCEHVYFRVSQRAIEIILFIFILVRGMLCFIFFSEKKTFQDTHTYFLKER